jgi:hypothetical protein
MNACENRTVLAQIAFGVSGLYSAAAQHSRVSRATFVNLLRAITAFATPCFKRV